MVQENVDAACDALGDTCEQLMEQQVSAIEIISAMLIEVGRGAVGLNLSGEDVHKLVDRAMLHAAQAGKEAGGVH